MSEPVPGTDPAAGAGAGSPGTAAATIAEAGGVISSRSASLWTDAWRDLRHRWVFWGSVAILLLVTVMAVAPRLFTDIGKNEGCDPNLSKLAPGGGHPFGTDVSGCDY